MGDPAKPSPVAASPPAKTPSPTKSPSSPVASPGATEASAPLVADEHPEEDTYDLGIDVGAGSDTASLRSSILRYREENGRTYHAYKDGCK